MSKTKLLAGVLLVLAVLLAQVGTVLAAPAAQSTTTNITGTIVSVITETDENGVTTVLVTYTDAEQAEQQVRLTLEAAVAEGLVAVDSTTKVTVLAQAGEALDIDPSGVIPDQEEPTDEAVNPIAALLAKFFNVEPSVVQGYHEDGFGFGVIAQAMWMAKGLSEETEGTPVDAGLILQAKKTGDYSAFTQPDGTTPTNWGQFKKALMDKDKKNLGVIVSGHATTDGSQEVQQNNGHGNGYGKENKPGKGRGNNKP
jgi:ABC-type glycerol-3-phosphate transport system substrate-binding protein